MLVKPLPAGCRLTGIFDSCHSGTVMDLPYVVSIHSNTGTSLPVRPPSRHDPGSAPFPSSRCLVSPIKCYFHAIANRHTLSSPALTRSTPRTARSKNPTSSPSRPTNSCLPACHYLLEIPPVPCLPCLELPKGHSMRINRMKRRKRQRRVRRMWSCGVGARMIRL